MAQYTLQGWLSVDSMVIKSDKDFFNVYIKATKTSDSGLWGDYTLFLESSFTLGDATYSATAQLEGKWPSVGTVYDAALQFKLDARALSGVNRGETIRTRIETTLYGAHLGREPEAIIKTIKYINFSIGDTFTITNEDGTETPVSLYPDIGDGLFSYVAVDDILPGKPANMLVKGYSKASITFDTGKVETKFDATVARIDLKFKHGSAVYSTEDFTQPLLTDVLSSGTSNDNMPVIITVTDSRGFSTEVEARLYAYGYSRPVLTGMSAYRSDKDKNENDEGTYLTVQASERHTALEGYNNCVITAEWGIGGSLGSPIELENGIAKAIADGYIQPTSSYVVKFTARDDVGNENVISLVVPTPSVTFDALNGGNGFAFGKMAERDGVLESVWDISSHGSVQAGVEQREEDGKFVPKAQMDKDGNIHGKKIEVSGTVAGDGAAFKNDVYANVGDFTTAVASDLGEFNRINLTTSLDGSEAAGRFKQLTVSDKMVSNAEIEANGGIAGVTNYPAAGVEELTGGKWIDGKSIYRFLWQGTTTHKKSQKVMTNFPNDITPDTVVSLTGMLKRSDGEWMPIPNAYYGSSDHTANLRTYEGNGIYLGLGDGFDGTKTVVIIAEYTKK